MNWYYAADGHQLGPVDHTKLQELIRTGRIGLDSLVWREGMNAWLPYRMAVPDAPARSQYGGFWIRGLALLIDVVVVAIACSVIQVPLAFLSGGASLLLNLSGLMSLVWIILDAAYHTYFLSAQGATLGKTALGLKVVTATGAPLSVGLALGRYLASWLSMLILWIGYIMAAFDSQKRTLHDRICSTRVVRVSR